MSENESNKIIRKFIGVVSSNKMDKTVVVKIEKKVQHKVYKKLIKLSKSFKVHDEKNEAKVGDRVVFQECRPLSKEKRWRIVEILKK